MRIAFLTTRLVETPRSGGEICTWRLLEALRGAGHAVLSLGRAEPRVRVGDGDEAIVLGPLVRPFDELGPGARLAALGSALSTGRACTVQRLLAGGAARRAGLALRGVRRDAFDLLVVDHLQACAWLRDLEGLPPIVLVMHNIESDGYLRRARRVLGNGWRAAAERWVLRREARLLRELELRAFARCAAVACLSSDDARRLHDLMRGLARPPVVEVLPGFPQSAPLPPALPAADGIRRVGLIGTWSWGPNRDALRWMLDEVLPRLPVQVRLVLAGGGLEGLALPPRVQSLGRVADAAALYAAVDVVAVPSLHGSGVQEKAIEATGTGRPVVATPHALRGLGPGLPLHVHAAEDAGHFAQLCATVPLRQEGDGALEAWVAARRQRYGAALTRCLQAGEREPGPRGTVNAPLAGAQ